MRVQDVMTRSVRTIGPEAPASEALALMNEGNFHHLVVSEDRGLVGIVSSRDLGSPLEPDFRETHRVADVMNPHVVTATPDMPLKQAANIMRGRSIGCLPVVRPGRPDRLVGILTISDLLDVLGRGVDRPSRPDRMILKARAPRKSPHATRSR